MLFLQCGIRKNFLFTFLYTFLQLLLLPDRVCETIGQAVWRQRIWHTRCCHDFQRQSHSKVWIQTWHGHKQRTWMGNINHHFDVFLNRFIQRTRWWNANKTIHLVHLSLCCFCLEIHYFDWFWIYSIEHCSCHIKATSLPTHTFPWALSQHKCSQQRAQLLVSVTYNCSSGDRGWRRVRL